jgi:hypothetical protein
MNLTPYNDNFRLNGYYPQVTKDGQLVEPDIEYERRQERRQNFIMAVLGIGAIALMVFALTLVDMRDKHQLAVIAITQNKPLSQKQEKEIFNFRKYVGLDR